MSQSIKTMKKMNARMVYGSVAVIRTVAEAGAGKKVSLYAFNGAVTGTKRGDSDNGPWLALSGTFYSVNSATGEVGVSPLLYIPLEAATYVAAGLGKDVISLKISGVVGVEFDAKSAVGYTNYCTLNAVEGGAVDPLMLELLEMRKTADEPEDEGDTDPEDGPEPEKKGAKK